MKGIATAITIPTKLRSNMMSKKIIKYLIL